MPIIIGIQTEWSKVINALETDVCAAWIMSVAVENVGSNYTQKSVTVNPDLRNKTT